MEKEKVYISGRVTGLDLNEVKKQFSEFEDKINSCGYQAVNPINNGLTEKDPWIEHMCVDLKMLYYCDAILMLKGWEESRGAYLEHEMARVLGKAIMFEENVDWNNFKVSKALWF